MLKVILLLILITCVQPVVVSADSLPFDIPKNDLSQIKPVSSDSLFGGLLNDFGGTMAPVYKWGVKYITILFVVATLVMILSALFKNGQWQKYAQLTMMLSFFAMLVLRGLPIIVLSIQKPSDVDILLQESLSMLSFGVIFLCVISIAVSFLFSFGYQLIEHPEFHRWAKTLRSVSILMMVFAIIIPWLFPIL